MMSRSYCTSHIDEEQLTLLEKIRQKCAPFLPALKYIPALLVSIWCVVTYYTECVDRDLNHFAHVPFAIALACALFAFPIFEKDSYCDVRVLLDFAQEVVSLPCVLSELLIKNDLASDVVNVLPALYSFGVLLSFVVFEYRRIDLTDLAIIPSMFCMTLIGISIENYFASAAALVAGGYYCWRKRNESCCLKGHQLFTYVMLVFNALAVAAFEPNKYWPTAFEISSD